MAKKRLKTERRPQPKRQRYRRAQFMPPCRLCGGPTRLGSTETPDGSKDIAKCTKGRRCPGLPKKEAAES